MNEAEVILYRLKQQQTNELIGNFKPSVALMLQQVRDGALAAWGEVGGGKKGQALLEVLMRQISDTSNACEAIRIQRVKRNHE